MAQFLQELVFCIKFAILAAIIPKKIIFAAQF